MGPLTLVSGQSFLALGPAWETEAAKKFPEGEDA